MRCHVLCIVVLIALNLLSSAVEAAPTLSEAELDELREEIRGRANMADYALFAEMVFSTADGALNTKDSLESGRTTLLQAMQKQRGGGGQQGGRKQTALVSLLKKKPKVDVGEKLRARHSEATADAQPGRTMPDMAQMMASMGAQDEDGDNLQTIDTVHPVVAQYVFDTSVPYADTTGPHPVGPIELGESTHVLIIVFHRYRRSFFGDEWLRLEQYCADNGIDFGRTVRDLANQKDLVKAMIFQLYRDESTYLRLVRLAGLNRDLKRVGTDTDPSIKLGKVPPQLPAGVVESIVERRRLFNARLHPWVLEKHPEALMMDEDEVIANGWVTSEDGSGGGVDRGASAVPTANDEPDVVAEEPTEAMSSSRDADEESEAEL